MFGQRSKVFFISFICLVTLGPIVAMVVWNPTIGCLLFLIGVGISYRCLQLVRITQVEGMVNDQAALYAKQNHATSIYISLLNDDGQPLDHASAQARLAVAQAQAGPRDTVIGVHRQI